VKPQPKSEVISYCPRNLKDQLETVNKKKLSRVFYRIRNKFSSKPEEDDDEKDPFVSG
jgi:hypothetical protein